jgi:hypothetical protein
LAVDWFLSAFGFLLSLLPFRDFDMAILPIERLERFALVSKLSLGCAFTETESSELWTLFQSLFLEGAAILACACLAVCIT